MGFAAAITSRIELATGVLILPQRQTVLVAQQAADVDLLSHGRLRLGVGTGWNWVEYDALGQDFASRGRRLTEQVSLLRRLWSEPLVTFDGEFDHIERGCINPRPRRQIPIWFGGFGEAAFRRASRMGDGFSFAGDVEGALERLDRVRALLAGEGRDGEQFGLELILTRARAAADVVDTAAKWAQVGGTHVSILTMKVGLDGYRAHVGYLAEVKTAIARAVRVVNETEGRRVSDRADIHDLLVRLALAQDTRTWPGRGHVAMTSCTHGRDRSHRPHELPAWRPPSDRHRAA